MTTISQPVVRGPAALAKAAAALDLLSDGRFVLGVGPGSSRADYELARVDFEERWPRFEAAVRELRAHLGRDPDDETQPLEPRPPTPDRPPIWVGSWGSAAGLRRVNVHLGDHNSHKDGGQWCSIEAKLAGLQPLAAKAEAGSVNQAIDAAAGKLLKVLDHAIGRKEDPRVRITPRREEISPILGGTADVE